MASPILRDLTTTAVDIFNFHSWNQLENDCKFNPASLFSAPQAKHKSSLYVITFWQNWLTSPLKETYDNKLPVGLWYINYIVNETTFWMENSIFVK